MWRSFSSAFGARRVSPVEVVDAISARIDAIDSAVGGFTALSLERARDEARGAEAAWSRGEPRALEGIPFGVKDLFDTEAVRTAYGSPMFDSHVPTRDAEAVRRARAAGAVLVGKTQTHEFAWGITSVNERMGTARNPWARDRVSGGSSGGSAVVLAAGEVPLALGSDTGGSIRVPASFCGVVGLKPTYGRISAAGAWPLARSLDHPGPMARTPVDVALLLEAIAGVTPLIPLRATLRSATFAASCTAAWRGSSSGSARTSTSFRSRPTSRRCSTRRWPHSRRRVRASRRYRCRRAELSYPAFGVIQRAEALDTHRRAGLYPARRDEYGADVLGRLDAAAAVTLEDYLAAAADRERVRSGFARLFRSCDVLLTPVSAAAPLPIGDETVLHDGVELSFRDLVMSYTTPQDLVGLPACAVRAGFDALGIPVGVQFTGPPWSEALVLRAAQGLFEATDDVQGRRPPLP